MTEDEWQMKVKRARTAAAVYRRRTSIRGRWVPDIGWVYRVEIGEARA